MTMNDWRFLVWPLDAQKHTQQLNLQLLSKKTNYRQMIQQLAVNGSTQGIEPAGLNR